MRWWTGSALIQVMAWRRTGAKPLPEPMLTYCQFDPWEQLQWNSSWMEIHNFSFMEMHLKMFSAKMATILSMGRWVKLGISVRLSCCWSSIVSRSGRWLGSLCGQAISNIGFEYAGTHPPHGRVTTPCISSVLINYEQCKCVRSWRCGCLVT